MGCFFVINLFSILFVFVRYKMIIVNLYLVLVWFVLFCFVFIIKFIYLFWVECCDLLCVLGDFFMLVFFLRFFLFLFIFMFFFWLLLFKSFLRFIFFLFFFIFLFKVLLDFGLIDFLDLMMSLGELVISEFFFCWILLIVFRIWILVFGICFM